MTTNGPYLLDTHVLLWWLSGDARLSRAREAQIRAARALVSAASVWEVAIKHQLGKLPVSPQQLIEAIASAGFDLLAIEASHAAATALLPTLHQDPFDRLLLAQAKALKLTLLTADRQLVAYGRRVEQI
ncbi:type II toxin-antitoxin system VapC family toxin [Cyanobium sp. ATX 6F1]|uniref:type II toxin-antitoxin system VapC family toxin n=1 Tax=unclassified Cyanobium TaxID=2627006 RepID=UPI0020CFC79F|nr:type II toxin-antitoxin system VapC family toxin [Cyanobium sp. ATX 6F1]MCP9915146.1 type II toxin-antitoxin system VapC family toxin [Cyanobium sp. ATX 6F1]